MRFYKKDPRLGEVYLNNQEEERKAAEEASKEGKSGSSSKSVSKPTSTHPDPSEIPRVSGSAE